MIRVCGLDLSLVSTGACDIDGSLITIKTGKRRGGERLDFILTELTPLILNSDLLVVEGQSFNARGRSHFSLAELHGCVKREAHRRGVRIELCPPATLKLWAAGHGRASKEQMMQAAIDMGYAPKNDDEADAGLLREWGIAQLLH